MVRFQCDCCNAQSFERRIIQIGLCETCLVSPAELAELRRKVALYDAGVATLNARIRKELQVVQEPGDDADRAAACMESALRAFGVEPNGEG